MQNISAQENWKTALAYKVEWHEDVLKDMEKLDKETAKKIIERIKTYLINEPIKLGKALSGQFEGLYRYRYGDYRALYVVDLEDQKIIGLKIRHRKDVYEG
jgi:mRNA interferase RelE/StbE